MREESSVAARLDEDGELVFPSAPGPVIHRTPEELGMPRVVPDRPVARVLNVRPDFEDRRVWNRRRGESVRRGLRRDQVPVRRSIRGVRVRMPAGAVMGAEMIDVLADEEQLAAESADRQDGEPAGRKVGEEAEEKVGNNNYDLTSEANRKIAAAPLSTPAAKLAAEIGVPVARIYAVRSQLYREGKLAKPAGRERERAAHREKPEKRAEKSAAAAAAASFFSAGISIEFTGEEVELLVARMTGAQRLKLFSGGLRAALLG